MYVMYYLNYPLVKQYTDFCLRLKQERWSLSEAQQVGVCVGVVPLIRNWALCGTEWRALRYRFFICIFLFMDFHRFHRYLQNEKKKKKLGCAADIFWRLALCQIYSNCSRIRTLAKETAGLECGGL
jgi:hypothetical protein